MASHARSLLFPARDIALSCAQRCGLSFSVVGGFVGGDIVAGMLVARIMEREGRR